MSMIKSAAAMALMLGASQMGRVEDYSRSYSNPIFIPRKHTKMTYGAQQRLAKKRKKSKN